MSIAHDERLRSRRTPALASIVTRLSNVDFSAGRPALALSAAYIAARLPLLGGGYGADTDAYRVVLAGRYFWAHGEYIPSRLPGFPLHEAVVALLLWGGPLLTNAATVAAGLVAVLLFARLTRALDMPSRGLATLGLAFIPYMAVTSSATYDYHWALAAMLGGYLAYVRGRPRLAGGLVGIAAGFRITSLLMLAPLVVLCVRARRLRGAAELAGSTGLVAALVFLPVAIPYRFRFLDYADSSVSPDGVIRVVGQWALGAAGAIAVIAVLGRSWRRVVELPRLAARDAHVLAWVVAVIAWGVAFLRLPVDLGYLIPVYPFGLLLLARVVRPALLAGALAVVVASGGVDLDIQGLHNFDPRVAVETVRPSWRVAGIPHDWQAKRRWRTYARAIPAVPVPEHSVVLTGGAFPDVAVENWNHLRYAIAVRDRHAISMLSDDGLMVNDARDVVYLAVATPELLDQFLANGYSFLRVQPAEDDWHEVLVTSP